MQLRVPRPRRRRPVAVPKAARAVLGRCSSSSSSARRPRGRGRRGGREARARPRPDGRHMAGIGGDRGVAANPRRPSRRGDSRVEYRAEDLPWPWPKAERSPSSKDRFSPAALRRAVGVSGRKAVLRRDRARTAFTRRLISGCQVSPSFRKIEWVTFSTECSVITTDRAIAALDLPCAISSRIWRSRGVRSSSGDSRACPCGNERLDDLRVDHRSVRRNLADRAGELFDVSNALLQQVRTAIRATIEECQRVLRFDELAEHDDTRSRDACLGAGRQRECPRLSRSAACGCR